MRRARATEEGFETRRVDFAVDIKLARVTGTIQSTLSEAVDALGEYPVLINNYVELFGWAMDFYRERVSVTSSPCWSRSSTLMACSWAMGGCSAGSTRAACTAR